MIYIYKKDADGSVFNLNQTTGQVEETKESTIPPAAEFTLDPTDGELSYDQDQALRDVEFIVNDRGYLAVESYYRAIADTLQYNGTFLDIPFLSVTIKSSAPIDWEIGDFIVWEYDGNEYYLKDMPSEAKQASVGTYGEAFIYENVKFVSRLSDTKNVSFLDVVAPESGLHYTTLPAFSFYGKVSDLISRINANLGRLYANWSVVEADLGETGDVYEAMQEYREVEVSNISCWEAIGLVYSLWKVGFVYSYVGGVNTITIGAQYVNTNPFSYGQGNGLYLIRKNIAQEDSIVTRLRVYGSADNMPPRYYNNIMIGGSPLISEMQYIPNLMIPYSKWGTTAGVPDVQKAYIDADNADVDAADTSMDKYGVREKTLYFDGSGDLEDIKPTIERLTAGELRAAITSYAGTQVYYAPSITYADSDRMDVIKVADDTADDGNVDSAIWYDEEAEYIGEEHNYNVSDSVFSTILDPMYGATLSMAGEYKVTFTEQTQVISAMNTTINRGVMRVWLLKNGNRSSLKASVHGTLGLTDITFTIPTFNVNVDEEGDVYSIELAFELFVLPPIGEEGILTLTTDEGTATYAYTKSIPNNRFSIQIREVGFDIMKFLAGGGQSPSISMRTGACAGREFVIRSTERVTDGWKLNCVRQADTSLNQQLFPNNIFKIAEGDTFVLLNMSMPEILVETNSIRLYNKGCEWLRKAKEPVLVYEPLIDEVYMAHNPELIKEGMAMPITDTDLGIDEVVLINSVIIEENGESIRTYSVVLREQGDTSLISYINSRTKQQANSTVRYIVNAVTATTQSAEVLSSFAAPAQEETSYSAILSALDGKHPLNGTLDLDFKARELWATRLRLPKTAPTSMTENEWYISIEAAGFSGVEPEAPTGTTSLWGLTDDVIKTGTEATGQALVFNGTKWTNTTLGITNISGLETALSARMITANYPDLTAIEALTGTSGLLKKTASNTWTLDTTSYAAASHAHSTYLPKGISANGVSMNTIKVDGTYYGYNMTDSAQGGISTFIVLGYSNDWGTQIQHNINNRKLFFRSWTGTGGVMDTSWYELYHSGNINRSDVPFTASTLTLNGAISGATNITASGTIQMAENNNARLRLPKTAPTSMTEDEWYISMEETGFAGEEPVTPTGTTSLWGLTDDVVKTGTESTGQALVFNGTKWTNITLGISNINGLQTALDGKTTLNGTGFVKASGTTISYDNSTYLTTSAAATGYIQNQASGIQTGGFWVSANTRTEGQSTATNFNVPAYNTPNALKFNGDLFTFGMVHDGGYQYMLQAQYYGSSSYSDYSRGFRVYNSYDSTQEFFVGHGRLDLSRITDGTSEFSSLQNSISFDKARLNFYHLDYSSNYMRVLDIAAYGRTDGTGHESMIRFLTNGDTAYSGSVEVARMWKGCFSIGYTNSTAYSYKLSVAGSAYFSGTVIMAENDNTRLCIPSSTPTGMTYNKWYLYIS